VAAVPGDLLPAFWTLLGDLGLLDCLPGTERFRLLTEAARVCLSSPRAFGFLLDSGGGGGKVAYLSCAFPDGSTASDPQGAQVRWEKSFAAQPAVFAKGASFTCSADLSGVAGAGGAGTLGELLA